MFTKLTLSINKDIIEEAKKYARKRNTSLSNLIENFLVSVTNKGKANEDEISPLVKSLSGVIKADAKTTYKKQHGYFLANKYK
jgi:hypothetical protein